MHTVKVTAANQHDVSMSSELLTGEETTVYGDSGYLGAEKREDAMKQNNKGKHISYKVNRRPSQIAKKSSRSQGQLKRREQLTQLPQRLFSEDHQDAVGENRHQGSQRPQGQL